MNFKELAAEFGKIAAANVAAEVVTEKGNSVLWRAREAIDVEGGRVVPFGPVVFLPAKDAAGKDTAATAGKAAKDTAAPSAHDAAVARLVEGGLLPSRDTAKRRALIAAAVKAGSIPAP